MPPTTYQKDRKKDKLPTIPRKPAADFYTYVRRRSPRRIDKKTLLAKIRDIGGIGVVGATGTAAAAVDALIPTATAILLGGVPGLAVGAAENIGLFFLAKYLSEQAYKKYFTYKEDVDRSRFDEVMNAGDFMYNSYDNDHEVEGWDYEWINHEENDVAFFAEHINPETNQDQIVFGFRGTSNIPDALADANASHAVTITEWAGFPLFLPITAAAGFVHRMEDIGRKGLGKIVESLLETYEKALDIVSDASKTKAEPIVINENDIFENTERKKFGLPPVTAEDKKRKPDIIETVDDVDPFMINSGEELIQNMRNLEKKRNKKFDPRYYESTIGYTHDQDIDDVKNKHYWRKWMEAELPDPDRISGEGILDNKPVLIEDILITGHSLGGAVATLFTAILAQILPPELAIKIRLITFEPARVLRKSTVDELVKNPIFADIAENAIYVTNGEDPVPQLPLGYGPEKAFSGFQHFGKNWHIDANAINVPWVKAHSSDVVMDTLKRLKRLNAPNASIYISNGSGKRRSKKKSSPTLKARMAYVRSFKKT